jgi:hypothetical protein
MDKVRLKNDQRRRGRPSLRSTDPARVLLALDDERALKRAGLHELATAVTRARARFLVGVGGVIERQRWALVTLAAARVIGRELDDARAEWLGDALSTGASAADVAAAAGLDSSAVAELIAGER